MKNQTEKKTQEENKLKDLTKKVEKAPKKKTFMDAETDKESLESWEKDINSKDSN